MYQMDHQLRADVLQRLEADLGLRHINGTDYMRKGTCPACHKTELFTSHANPWVVKCGREAKCGQTWHVKELYSDLFEDWSERFKPTNEAPAASADGYLQFARGFDLGLIKGWYTQENYWDRDLGIGSATVRFEMPAGGYWERLIDRPNRFGSKKARFKPAWSYKGKLWVPPTVDLLQVQELWIVEGIFDAIALLHHGIQAVSMMSSAPFPEEALKELARTRGPKLPKLVWALDNEPTARENIRKWVRLAKDLGYRNQEAAQIPQPGGRKVDWNDLHQRWMFEKEDKRKGRIERDLEIAHYQGTLLLADSPKEKALRIYGFEEASSEFYFDFGNRMYWAKFDLSKLDEEQRAILDSDEPEDRMLNENSARRRALENVCSLKLLANCNFETLYKQISESTGEAWYYLRVNPPHDGPAEKLAFTPKQMASSGEFKAKLLHAGATWLGTQKHLDQIVITQTEGVKTVETIDFMGYSKDHQAYIFNDIACHNGNVVKANSEDYFELGKRRVKSPSLLKIKAQPDSTGYREDWLPKLWLCFGAKGLITLTYWFGSLFAEQIRGQYESFPFLEVTGEPDAGKSTLLVFIWKLFGRNYEGFDPTKGSASGRSRAMGQVAGMPVVLLEGDRNSDAANTKSFDWDELKDFFGGGLLRTRGVKNNTNETYEPPFRGTIVISQNAPVTGHEAILSRIVKLHFTKPKITEASSAAADAINLMEIEELSHFLVKAIKAEPQVMALFAERYPHHRQRLRKMSALRSARVVKNHAMILALVDCLALILPLSETQLAACDQQLLQMAMERQSAISADPAELDEFWAVYDYLESRGDHAMVNHAKKPDELIAINLNQFAEKAAEFKQKIPDLNTLRRMLPDCRRHKLVGINISTSSEIRTREMRCNPLSQKKEPNVKCWHFKP
ncbi:hypothetical protein QE444_001351 [Pseudomonas sp. SORGH_AS199]|uniref:toprim domain-containing protein n=1 Tax=Pseudomonas sp. SORGH_AS_0199 TaxID=3041761 RepID=UPI002857FD01|nr:toprim domain-containing protein [Pseudomonas sp. SORGH_AS_0199]MDR6228994.1 hypothetical protein [Pseudomonas sp. SORGH_AS_0199]